jgi:hypothetical protein
LIEPSAKDQVSRNLSEAGEAEQQQQERLRTFFREKLLAVANRSRERGVCFLPDMADKASCYLAYSADVPELVEASACISEEALCRLWKEQGLPELADLAGSLLELRVSLKQTRQETAGDVSPFIYAMF